MKPVKPSPRIPCFCPQCTGTLFHMPDPPRERRARASSAATYTRYTPRVRVLCDDCIADIHKRGQAVAPYPMAVRWRRRDTDGVTTHLCETHKDKRQEADQ